MYCRCLELLWISSYLGHLACPVCEYCPGLCVCECVCACACVLSSFRVYTCTCILPAACKKCVQYLAGRCTCACFSLRVYISYWCSFSIQVVQVTDEAKFSSSAVDTKAFLLQMGSFWQNLSWPVAAEAYGFTVTIIQAGGVRIVFTWYTDSICMVYY